MKSAEMSKILERWPRAEDFYRERDNRTELEVRKLESYAVRPVEIVVDPLQAHTLAVQQAALVACNLTSRWARNVTVTTPEVNLCAELRRDGFASLGERILAEMFSADPFGSFDLRNDSSDLWESEPRALRLFVGPWEQDISRGGTSIRPDDYVVHARGWSALGSRASGFAPGTSGPATAAAAALAACVGASDLFKRSVGHSREEWIGDYSWCTWAHTFERTSLWQDDSRPVPSSLDLGSVLLAGVGAIGSALAYMSDFLSLRGRLVLLDRDHVETSNLNRSPLFGVEDAFARREKTFTVKRYLTRQKELRLDAVNGTWSEYGAALARDKFDLWISLTNEDAAWAQVPFQLPPVVLHGTTTSGWGFGAGRHIPRLEDCTMCRLPRPAALFRGPCAEGEVGGDDEVATARASLPFLSAASASLVLAEMLKLGALDYPLLPNDVSADLRYGLPAVVAVRRMPTEGCRGCRASHSRLWEARGGQGCYRIYSEAA